MQTFSAVASFTDAWIETLQCKTVTKKDYVASFTDAWIETHGKPIIPRHPIVASFTDAWIETVKNRQDNAGEESHLLQMRGLKLTEQRILKWLWSRIFYRCVD